VCRNGKWGKWGGVMLHYERGVQVKSKKEKVKILNN
jgi:hypothetical protein